MSTARETALIVLRDIDENGAYSNMSLKNNLKKSRLSGVDRAFVSNLVYGTVSRRITLDYIIKKYSKVKIKKISPFILNILRMGIYQIYFMSKVPESAAVNESVKLARRYGHKASAGFVNGMLHSVINGKKTLCYPNDKIKNMSVKYSFPEWMCEKFIKEFGEERASELMRSLNSAPSMTIRANTLKITREELSKRLSEKGIDNRSDGISPFALEVSGLDVGSEELYRDGFFTVQDSAAQLASVVLDPKPDDTVIDMCAAPGGKSTHMAQLMDNRGKIYAFDVHEHKIDIIKANAARMGIDIIDARICDGTAYNAEFAECADRILADVPCSGWGIIRKKPDIKYNARENSDLADIQYAVLENAARYLKKGGVLVYSTCTINPDENERVIERFLKEHAEFAAEDISGFLPDGFSGGENGYITLYPDIHNTDGFFISRLRKK